MGADILLHRLVKRPETCRVVCPVTEVAIVVHPVDPHAVELKHVERRTIQWLEPQRRLVAMPAIKMRVLEFLIVVDRVVEPTGLRLLTEDLFIGAVQRIRARVGELEHEEVEVVADWIVGDELGKALTS